MKSFGKRYAALNTRVAVRNEPLFRQLPAVARRLVMGAVLVAIFAASVNLLVKSVIGRFRPVMPEIKLPRISGISSPKFQIIGDHEYLVMSDGSVKMAEANIDGSSLPVLSGISINEDRQEYKAALKEALSIAPSYLEKISEINLRDPKEMMMVSTDGSRIIFGDSITGEKLDNYIIALKKMEELGRPFKVMDLRFSDRVVLK
ncbi:MAG: cell division protein FtsQ/DivIB [Candidatus Goldiibacteriota bacterium]|jgi:hypothetical protein